MAKYPRLYIKDTTRARIAKIAKKRGVTMKAIGDKIAVAGIRALEL